MNALARHFAVAALAIGAGRAQTYIVDAAGGAGAQFPSIAAAVAAVPSGAVLLVRPGTYSSFSIDAKSLAVFADPGVAVVDLGTLIEVKNLAANQAVVLHRVLANGGLWEARFSLQNCAGPVVLQQCGMSPPAWSGTSGARLAAVNCSDLHVVDCAFPFGGQVQLAIAGGRAVVVRTTAGGNSWQGPATVTAAHVDFVDCVFLGGGVLGPTAPILQMDATSVVRLAGATRILSPTPAVPSWGIGPAGTVWMDPAVQVNATTPIVAGVTTIVQGLPSVDVSAVPFGTATLAQLRLPAAGIGGLFVGLATAPFQVPPFSSPTWLDPTTAVPLAAGVAPIAASFVVPALPALRGLRLCWQGWSHDPVGAFQLSPPVVIAPW